MSSSKSNNDAEFEWRLMLQRRLIYAGLVLGALVLGIFAYRWIARDVGLGKIGEHYRQAEELEK